MSYIGTAPTIGNFQVCDAISVVNGQASYTMQVSGVNATPQSANHMLVSLNGILQAPNSSFTVSGSTITFASNLVTGDVIDFIQILGDVLDLGVPSDNTVSLAKLTATGTKDATTFLRGDNTFASAGGDNTPAFTSYLSSNQNFTSDTLTKVQFDTEVFDSNSAYDNSTNYRFTVPSGEAGKYFIFAQIVVTTTSNNASLTELRIYKNGSNFVGREFSTLGSSILRRIPHEISFIDNASAGDYYEIYGNNNGTSPYFESGAKQNVFGAYKLIGV